jgi:hypothetical protein
MAKINMITALNTALHEAMAGLKPVVEMQFSGFSYLMMHQLEGNASRMRTRSRGRFIVPLVVRMPYGGGVRALEHHSESKEVYWSHTAGVKVVIPSSPANAAVLLAAAINDPDPVVFMEPNRSYRSFKEEMDGSDMDFKIGKAHVLEQGRDITLLLGRHDERHPQGSGTGAVPDRIFPGDHRSAHPLPHGYRHHCGIGEKDRPVCGGAGGPAILRPGIGDHCRHQ